MIKISIVVPVYNVELYLKECIEHLLKQTYKNIEIILVNDGSQDSSYEICKKYEEQVPYIKLIDKENGGLSDARNVGILNSDGDYIIFIDSDDYWRSDFLQDLVNQINENKENVDYIFFKFIKFYEHTNKEEEEVLKVDREKIIECTGKEAIQHILEHNKHFGWYAWRGLVKKEFLIENNIFFEKGRNYEDVLWTPKIWLNSKVVDYYSKPVYMYRLNREGQITSIPSSKNIKDSIYSSSFWLEEIKKYEISSELKTMILNSISVRYFYAIWFSGFLKDENKNEIYNLINKNKELLKYTNTIRETITSFLVNTIGVKKTSNIFKYIIKLKRLL